jgi:predicted phage terminase large subunit-like protein
VTIRYPIWRLSINPQLRVVVGAYSQLLANKFSRKARRIAQLADIPLSQERNAIDDWETTEAGGFRSIGVGAGITGQGADLLIIDDPVKSREEANSETYRERVWDWYSTDIYTRLEPHGSVMLIMTRWHPDDLAGRILASEDGPNWRVINFPAEAEENDVLGRKVGEPLCPQRFGTKELVDRKTVLGELQYAALYQQRPTPAGGTLAKREWFSKILPVRPIGVKYVRFWDLAATEKTQRSGKPDYTVGTLMTVDEANHFTILDVVRERVDPTDVLALMKRTAEFDGHTVVVGFEREMNASAKIGATAIVANMAGYAISGIMPRGDKIQRVTPFLSQAKVGNINLVKGEWNDPWLNEICAFPFASHDDQVDSVSGAFSMLANMGGWSRGPSA